MTYVRYGCALLLLFLHAAPLRAQLAKLYPVDEATANPEFFSLRAHLLQAVATRDTTFLYSLLAPDILNSFGGDGGIAEFKENWRPADAQSRLWPELAAILSLGGSFLDDTLFVAPYTHSDFPGQFDGFEHLAVIGNNVRVRSAASTEADVLTQLSFDIVPIARAADAHDAPWRAVLLADGRTGYIYHRYVRSPNDYRAGFVRRGDRWLLRVLVAGD